jgi:hypothetical protein
MKNIFLFLLSFCFATVAKTQIDYTGNYGFQKKVMYDKDDETKPSKDEINQGSMGSLTLLKIDTDKYKFWLSCNRGWPSFNMGDIDGFIKLDSNKASFVNTLEYTTSDSSCKLLFFFNAGYIKVEQNSADNDCGFGHAVYASGKYKKQNALKIKNAGLQRMYYSIEKYSVSAEKIYLSAEANAGTMTKQYFIKGDIVIAIREKDGFIYTEFITPGGKLVYGWLNKLQLTLVKNKI